MLEETERKREVRRNTKAVENKVKTNNGCDILLPHIVVVKAVYFFDAKKRRNDVISE